MLVWLAEFAGTFPVLNLFRYITFRAGGATATAHGCSCSSSARCRHFDWLRLKQGKGQPIRTLTGRNRILPSAARRPWAA